ncbi:MAG: DoxX family protein [Nitrospinales bacterium]
MFKVKILDANLDRMKGSGMLFIRLALGVVFVGHGLQKLFGLFGGSGLSGTINFMEDMGLFPATMWGILLAFAELFGGLFALIGFYSRWAGLILSIVMGTAVFMVHIQNGLFLSNRGFEYAGSLLCMAIALTISGGGNISLDKFLKKGK